MRQTRAIYPTLTPAHRPNRFTPRAFNFKCTPAALPEILRHTVLMKNLAVADIVRQTGQSTPPSLPPIAPIVSLQERLISNVLLQPYQKYYVTQYWWRTWLFIALLLRWKVIIPPILTTSLIHFSLKGWENVLLEFGGKRVKCHTTRCWDQQVFGADGGSGYTQSATPSRQRYKARRLFPHVLTSPQNATYQIITKTEGTLARIPEKKTLIKANVNSWKTLKLKK